MTQCREKTHRRGPLGPGPRPVPCARAMLAYGPIVGPSLVLRLGCFVSFLDFVLDFFKNQIQKIEGVNREVAVKRT